MADNSKETAENAPPPPPEGEESAASETSQKRGGIIRFFVRHPNASNLLMAIIILGGLSSTQFLNTQFFPTVIIPVISVSVVWNGASAEDVESNIIEALEPGLRAVDGIKELEVTAREGTANLFLEFWQGTNMQKAISDVEQAVSLVDTLPEDSERATISQAAFYETVGSLVISGPFPEKTLKVYAKRIKNDLLRKGLDRVLIVGARSEEVWVQILPEELRRLGLTPQRVAERISALSQDLPSGTLGGASERQVRSVGFDITVETLANTEVRAETGGGDLMLSEIAEIEETFGEREASGVVGDSSAIEIEIQRAEKTDTISASEKIVAYLEEARKRFPPTLNITLQSLQGNYVEQRIDLLFTNARAGLILVLIMLFLFLNMRVAIWVAAGIPVAFIASFGVMYLMDLSVNMITMFGLLMMLGVVVDDAIVVGEHSATLRDRGLSPHDAAEQGARRMMGPVLASSLTTISAFLPIFMIRDVIGTIMASLGLVVIAVIVASLVECFFILPGHMRHALSHIKMGEKKSFAIAKFEEFREGPFLRIISTAYDRRGVTLSAGLAALLVTVAMVVSGRVGFEFFPTPDAETVTAHIFFAPGTPREEARRALNSVEEALFRAEEQLKDANNGLPLVQARFGMLGSAGGSEEGGNNIGDHVAQLRIQLLPSESRIVRTKNILEVWEREMPVFPGLDRILLRMDRAGPPGRGIDISLEDAPLQTLKEAAEEMKKELHRFRALSDITDTLPYGKEELVLEVTSRGKALGFTAQNVGQQMRNAFQGAIARRFARGDEEITVRVRLPKGTSRLSDFYLESPLDRSLVSLNDIVSIKETHGFMMIRRVDGLRTVSVSAAIDAEISTTSEIQQALEANVLPDMIEKYGISYSFGGRSEEQADAFSDLTLGLYVALALIYLILAWIFGHYGFPLVVMSIIPFGLVGAIWGHVLMGYPLTFLSMLSLLGLSGILVNGSIVLVTQIQIHLAEGMPMRESVIEGTKARLRAVLLTSITTVAGLAPLLFEQSLQAQFLKPMAITLVFGIAGGAFLVLFIVPALMGISENFSQRFFNKSIAAQAAE